MAVTGGSILAYASIKLFDPGEGDPVLTDHGFAWLDLLASERRRGERLGGVFELGSDGYPLVEQIPGIGLTNAPRLVKKDTRLTHYSVATTGTATWQEMLLPTGSPRVYRLHQPDGNAGVVWSATSTSSLPADPSLAVSLVLPDTPANWDAAALEPYVQLEFGPCDDPGTSWAIRLLKNGAVLMRWSGTQFLPYESLPNPSKGAGYSDGEEASVWLRCVGGRLLLSMDGGASYEPFGSDASPLSVASGPFAVRGQGGTILFGVHQLLLAEGDYTSRTRDTLTTRVAPTVVIGGQEFLPAGTSTGYTDLYDGRVAQYAATLTPASSTWIGPGWSVYRAPVIRSATYYLAPVAVNTTGSFTTPWDDRILSVDIEKPTDLGQSTATIRIKRDPGSVFSGGYRRRKVEITLGYKQNADATVSWVAFVGYIRSITPSRGGSGTGVLEIVADNVTARLRKRKWTELQVRSLAGLSVNLASDYVLTQFGIPLNSSYRLWHAWGELVALADGSADNPCELIRPGEDPWETLQRIQSYARLEVAVTDDGALVAVPWKFTTGTSHDLRAAPDTVLDLREVGEDLSNTLDYDETATAVLVAGEDAFGERVWAWAVDTEAETQPLSDRYCPWRELEMDEVRGACSPAMLMGRAQLLAQQKFGLAYFVDSRVYLHDEMSRRDSVFAYGFEDEGIPDGTEHILMAMRHHFEVRQDGTTVLETQLGLQRL